MKTELILVGRTADKHFQAGISDYAARISHYMPFNINVIPELRNTKNLTEEQQKQAEGELILKQLQPSDTVVLLDEHGQELRSIELARWLERKQQTARRLVFVIGGPYGFSPAVYERADEKLSDKHNEALRVMPQIFLKAGYEVTVCDPVYAGYTWIYRACTIIKGEPYHHE